MRRSSTLTDFVHDTIVKRIKDSGLWVPDATGAAGRLSLLAASDVPDRYSQVVNAIRERDLKIYESWWSKSDIVTRQLQPTHERLLAELNLEESLAAIDDAMANISGWSSEKFLVQLVDSRDEVRRNDEDTKVHHYVADERSDLRSMARSDLGSAFVFVDQFPLGKEQRSMICCSYAHELAHLHTVTLTNWDFRVEAGGLYRLETPGFVLTRQGTKVMDGDIINEYWAEMTALKILNQCGIRPFNTERVRVTGKKGSVSEVPAYVVWRREDNEVEPLETDTLIPAVIGESDRLYGWPLYKAMKQAVRSGERFTYEALRPALETLAAEGAYELYELPSHYAGQARAAEILSLARGLDRPYPFMAESHDLMGCGITPAEYWVERISKVRAA